MDRIHWPGLRTGLLRQEVESGMQVRELGHIVLYVRDIATSRAFYRDVLGWPEVATVGRMGAVFSSGRTHHELLLLEVGPDAAPPPPGRRLGLYHFGLKVGETDDELREASSASARQGSRSSAPATTG